MTKEYNFEAGSGGRSSDDVEVYHCTAEGANDWYLAVDVKGIDLLRTPQGFIRESPEAETAAWLTDDEWECEPVNIKNTPFVDGGECRLQTKTEADQ